MAFRLDGDDVEAPDAGATLLETLRDHLGRRAPKDGCSPQGQCGCCTVWVDGSPRVACVTPVRRVAGREVTTCAGLSGETARRWAEAFVDAGASQCGFCTPGIVMRLAALETRPGRRGREPSEAAIRNALLAHLCRCTGWQTIVEAAGGVLGVAVGPRRPAGGPAGADDVPAGSSSEAATADGAGAFGCREPLLASWRAELEGLTAQRSAPGTVLGDAGFADDCPPSDALVAVPAADGSWVVAPTAAGARRQAARVQGRNSSVGLRHPVEVPEGEWVTTLRTTWVEPAYLEPDASWCRPGGRPASPLANGGAFGGKRRSPVPEAARRLAVVSGGPVRALWSREDVVRHGPKRPPVAAGMALDGTGVLRVARTPGSPGLAPWVARVARTAPGLRVEEVEVPGPPVSADLRCAGWAEAAVLVAVTEARRDGRAEPGAAVEVAGRAGGRARVSVSPDGPVRVEVWAGEVLDEPTLRSYCIGAVHQALGWVRSEGVAVDESGEVQDLTIRSFGVLSARDMPWVEVAVHPSDRWPVNGSDAVFAAAAAAAWITDGLPPSWPDGAAGAAAPSS